MPPGALLDRVKVYYRSGKNTTPDAAGALLDRVKVFYRSGKKTTPDAAGALLDRVKVYYRSGKNCDVPIFLWHRKKVSSSETKNIHLTECMLRTYRTVQNKIFPGSYEKLRQQLELIHILLHVELRTLRYAVWNIQYRYEVRRSSR